MRKMIWDKQFDGIRVGSLDDGEVLYMRIGVGGEDARFMTVSRIELAALRDDLNDLLGSE